MKTRSVGSSSLRLAHLTELLSGAALLLTACLTFGSAEDGQSVPGTLKPSPGSGVSRLPSSGTSTALPKAPAGTTSVSVTEVSSSQEAGKVIILASTSGHVSHKAVLIPDPPRLVIDLLNAELASPFFDLRINSGGVKKVRVRQFQSTEPKIARMVIDLDAKHGKHEITADAQSLSVSFDAQATEVGQSETQQPKTGSGERVEVKKPAVALAPPPATARVDKTAASAAPKTAPKPVTQTAPAAPSSAPSQTSSAVAPAPPRTAPRPAPQAAPAAQPSAASQTDSAAAPPTPQTAAKPAVPVASAAPPPAASQADSAAAPAASKPAPAKQPRPSAVSAYSVAAVKPASPKPAAGKGGTQASTPLPVAEPALGALVPKIQMTALAARQAVPEQIAAAIPAKAPAMPALMMAAPQAAGYGGQPLTLDLIDISLVDFFRLMAEEGGINIVMDPEIKGTISIKVVKVPWDQIFEAALANNGLDKHVEGNLVRIARKTTLQEEAKQREALKKANMLASDVETRIKRLNYAKAAELVGTLTDQKTVRGTVVVDERTNSLLISDLPASVDRMVALVEKLDVPQPQVEIEARIVSATRDFARDIGVQFGFVAGNLQRVTVGGPNTFGTIGGTRPSATPMNTYAAGNPFTGRGASQAQTTQSGSISTGSTNDGNFNVNLPSQKPFGGIGISVGNIFDTFLLDAAITAGETKGLAKLISQPKVTAQNNSAATITQGLRFPVQIIANNTVTVQFQNAALTLTVTPQITYEGNVVLDLKVENNTPDFGRTVNGIPSIRTSESATRVLVSDGGTTVIGGILLDNETTQEDRVPGLASLPMIGNLFKRSFISHSTQEVLFFVTPRIVK